jgi:lipopolysaccharide biosynthesis glycosyltransferase
MNCIFCCVFNQDKYVDMFYLLLESILTYGNLDDNTNILVYTSTPFMDRINTSPLFTENKIKFEINDTLDTIDKACKARLQLFNLPSITNYNKILYLDTDIIVKNDINKVFDVCKEDTLYVLEEGNLDTGFHDHHGRSLFGDELNNYEDKTAFTSGILLFNNCEKIKDLFNKIIEDTIERPNDFVCCDQPYIVYNAFKYQLYNNKILKSLVVNNDHNIHSDKVIHHFPGGPGIYQHKIDYMTTFLNNINNYWTRYKNTTFLKNEILVLMVDNRQLSNEYDINNYWSNTAYINKNYCDKYGYDFKFINPYYKVSANDLYSCIDINTNELRHGTWSRIPVILYYLNNSYKYIVYIDSDCIFKNFNIFIEDKINKYADSSIIFQSNAPWHPTLPCSGFFICKNTVENSKFLKKWYTYKMPTYESEEWQNTLKMAQQMNSYDWHPGKHWDQDILWILIANNLYNTNCKLVIDTSEVGLIEKEGQYIRHVSTAEINTRNNYFNNIIIEMCKNNYPSYTDIIQTIYTETYDTSLLFNIFDTRNEMLKYYCNKISNAKLLEIGVFKGEFLNYLVN